MIILSDGRIVKAKDIVGSNFNILSFETSSGKQVSKLSQANANGFKDCYKIITTYGREIVRTYNHPLLCGHLEKNYSFKDENGRRLTIKPFNDGWKNCENIKVGDLVLVPTVLNVEEIDNPTFSNNDAKLLGYLLGDGGTTNACTFTQKQGIVLDEFSSIINSYNCKLGNTSDKYSFRVEIGRAHV